MPSHCPPADFHQPPLPHSSPPIHWWNDARGSSVMACFYFYFVVFDKCNRIIQRSVITEQRDFVCELLKSYKKNQLDRIQVLIGKWEHFCNKNFLQCVESITCFKKIVFVCFFQICQKGLLLLWKLNLTALRYLKSYCIHFSPGG